MSQYLILGCHREEESNDSILSVLKSRVANMCDEVCKFDVPEGLKFGAFDSLIKLMDDLSKYDNQIETVLRRVERQMLELDGQAEFKVLFRQKTLTPSSYVRSFVWDDTKYPRNRLLQENLADLFQKTMKIDDDVKNKAYSFTDVKTSIGAVTKMKGSNVSLTSVDFVDVLTPDIVSNDDFILKEHLTTVLVIVQEDGSKEFLESYERMDECVVPRSAKRFEKMVNGKLTPISDKDGNSLWRVVLFKKAVDNFRSKCKAEKFTVREFTYSVDAYKAGQQKMETLTSEYQKQELGLKRHCAAAFSDMFVAWMHLKAMRVFVESVLRYGVPPNFAAFVVKPTSKNHNKLRTVLSDVFSASGLFGQSYIGTAEKSGGGDGEEEAYYPYVSFGFTTQG